MMLRKVIIFVNLIFVSFCAAGQSDDFFSLLKSSQKKADNLYSQGLFRLAIPLYESILADDRSIISAKRNLANAYFESRLPSKARHWYSELINEDKVELSHKDQFRYIESLLSDQDYKLAQFLLINYLKDDSEDTRATAYLNSIQNLDTYFKDTWKFNITSLKLNTPEQDFSPYIWKDSLMIFISGRANAYQVNKSKEDDIYDLDIYQVPLHSVKEININPFAENRLNTKYPEGPLTFINDYTVVFSRSIPHAGKSDGLYKVKLYYSTLIRNKWSKAKELTINSDGYSTGHPFYDKKTGVLYFSSNRPGGYGDNDLYSSKYSGQKWTDPVNLGPKINSAGDEVFPTIKGDSLFFSSDGHGGLGLLDVFVTNLRDENSVISNIGSPINSSYDDFGFTWREGLNEGFFSTNRLGEKWKDEIYWFGYDGNKEADLNMVAQTINTRPDYKADLEVYDRNESLETLGISSPNPALSDIKLPNIEKLKIEEKIISKYVIHFPHQSYLTEEIAINLEILEEIKEYLNKNQNANLVVAGYTDSEGDSEYNKELARKRAQSAVNYLIEMGIAQKKIKIESYGETQPIASNETAAGRSLNRRVELTIID